MPKDITDKEEIARLGWKKEIVYDELYVTRDGRLIHREWLYRAKLFPCPICMSDKYVYLCRQPTGIYKGCLKCGTTEGPMPTVYRGTYYAELVSEKEITFEEGIKIIKRTGMKPPVGFNTVRRGKRRIRR